MSYSFLYSLFKRYILKYPKTTLFILSLLVIFMGIESAKFRAPVTPGCLLDLKVEFLQQRRTIYKFKGEASVDGKVTCHAEFTAMIADPPA